ncbi:sodium-dependent proline transporter-like [Ptychodera flava]|uniref:sodium-dependent proline transporter-like n=1 Tax=Ptychodera flava TaxID=63121 RepID=UPI00396A48C0
MARFIRHCFRRGNSYDVDDRERRKARRTNAEVDEEEQENGRGYWGHKADFILSSIGFAVGLGNVWRFPYLCYKNGGGAFLIPYVLMLALAGIPLFYLELAFGQFASLGCISIWKICPMFKGLGYGMVVVSALVVIYYNVIVSYTVFYTFASLTSQLPWAGCYNYWNSDNCFDVSINQSNTAYQIEKKIWPSQEYYYRKVLDISEDMDDIGGIRWQLALSLLFCWCIVYACVIKGIKSSGKVVYFTAVFPYIVLTILLIRGVMLPGAGKGLEFYLKPRWELLANPTVWRDAASQIFFSLGIAFGTIITFSSYNKFNNNACRDALIISLVNCGTSVYSGLVIFSTLGFMAHDSGVEVEDVVDEGAGLVFIVYPEAVSRLPGAPFWSFLFFFMLFTLGLDSQFAMFETVMTAIVDELPARLRNRKPLYTAIVASIMFLCGLPCTTRGGIYILTLMDWYSAGFSLLFIATIMCIVICYIYGAKRFSKDIEAMMKGFLPNWVGWRVCWMALSPLVMTFVMIFSFVKYSPASYGDYEFPGWAEAVGWILAASSMVTLPVFMVVAVLKGEGSLVNRIRASLRPTWDWGPAVTKNRITAGYDPLRGGLPPAYQLQEKASPNLYQPPPARSSEPEADPLEETALQ